MKSLCKLEALGLPVVTSLSQNLEHLCKLCKIRWKPDIDKFNCTGVIEKWQRKNVKSPPTWRQLHNFLKEMGLEELSQDIEDYFTSKWVGTYPVLHNEPEGQIKSLWILTFMGH